jgi:hypothetical protein
VAVLATLAAALVIVAGTAGPSSALPAVSDGEPLSQVLGTGARLVAPRARAADPSPLKVSIDSLSPSYVPKSGPIRVTGSVTNRDDQTWLAVNIYPFASAVPMTTRAELAAATLTDPLLPVGDRITTEGYYDSIGDIEPGASLQFSLSVPRSALTSQTGGPIQEPGVYWFGVHALGESTDGRDTNADGKARTFLPLVPADVDRPVDTALVIPLRRQVSFAEDGTLDDVDAWSRTLSPAGTLRSLVDFGAAAGSRPVTWLLDPALPDAVRQLVAGNPARYLGPTVADGAEDGDADGSPSPTVTAAPVDSPSPTPGGGEEEPEADPTLTAAMDAGSAWLDRLHEALGQDEILALPYGDLDVGAAAEHDPELIDRARSRSGTVLEPWGLTMSPAVGSPSGYLDRVAIQAVDPDTTVLVTDRMFGEDPPGVANTAGRKLVLTSSGAAAGGPRPGDPLSTVALRQRILSEAALRVISPGVKPLVVTLPAGWTPRDSSGFFEGLDVDWLRLTSVADATDRTPTAFDLADIDYPRRQGARELDAANFLAVDSLIRAGEALQNVLTRNDRIGSAVADQALDSASYASRANADGARVRVDRARAWIDDQLATIQITAPRGVTLSSASGRFATTITNGLDQPVTVRIEARTDSDKLRIRGPAKVQIPANSRTTVLLNAETNTPGVHNVTLALTDCPEDLDDPSGCQETLATPLGSSDQLAIRSAQVSKVIWLIIGTGAALLFGAIVVRLVRRVRRARRGPTTDPDPGDERGGDPAAAPQPGARPAP